MSPITFLYFLSYADFIRWRSWRLFCNYILGVIIIWIISEKLVYLIIVIILILFIGSCFFVIIVRINRLCRLNLRIFALFVTFMIDIIKKSEYWGVKVCIVQRFRLLASLSILMLSNFTLLLSLMIFSKFSSFLVRQYTYAFMLRLGWR